MTRATLIKSPKTQHLSISFVIVSINRNFCKGIWVASWFLYFKQWKIGDNHNRGNFSSLVYWSLKCAATFLIDCFCLFKLKLYSRSAQGLNNIIHIDFDYKKEFIYWVDSTRPSGRKINRMRLNGSDLKVSQLCYVKMQKIYWLCSPYTRQKMYEE